MGVEDQSPTLVVVASGPMHIVGRALEPAGGGSTWLDVNVSGVHLPQTYRDAEFVRMPDDVVARATVCELHGFCLACAGYGVPADRVAVIGDQPLDVQCSTCGGTGRACVTMTVVHDGPSVEASVTIDQRAAEQVPCVVCRAALTPS